MSTLTPLDREKQEYLLIPLIVSDSGGISDLDYHDHMSLETIPGACTSTVTFTLQVVDQDDNPPLTAHKTINVNILQVRVNQVNKS